MQSFLDVFRFLSPIPWDEEVVKAYAQRRLPLDMKNGNDLIVLSSNGFYNFTVRRLINILLFIRFLYQVYFTFQTNSERF
jgi:hypothetical protein